MTATNLNALTVFIVDDDPAVRDSLGLLLGLRGFRTALFASGGDFLAGWREDAAGCVVADIKMPGISGLELQAELAARGSAIPFVIITAHGDTASARTAFRAHAIDFLEKPFDDEQLVAAIRTAFEREAKRLDSQQSRRALMSRLNTLTTREREVMQLVAEGRHAREIAEALGISPRTVEVYKARMMAKLGADNVSDIVRLALEAENLSSSR